jgi:hypothetical protein
MHDLLDEFDRVFIINLVSRQDRREEMTNELALIGKKLQPGKIELFEACRPDSAGGFPTIGARGCFESHLRILRDAKRMGVNSVLILEDDLNFSADYLYLQTAVVDALRSQDWSIFYGGYRVDVPLPSERTLALCPPGALVSCTHFIGLHGDAIAVAADYLEQMAQRQPGDAEGGPMHVDGAYSWLRRTHPHLKTLMSVAQLGYQRASRTDIHSLAWYDRLGGVRELVASARAWRNRR